MRNEISLSAVFILAACSTTTETSAQSDAEFSWSDALQSEVSTEWQAPEHRAFDFWVGEWEMNWRQRPEGEFYHQKEGSWTRQRVFPILGGKAIVELAWARDNPEEASQRGFSIRYYDPAQEHWVMAQNWPNANNQGTAFLDQLIGEEHHGRLTMYSATRRPQPDGEVAVQHRRYNFADIQENSFRWDGSNTADKGVTWSTWSVVDAHKKRALDPFGAAGTAFPGVHNEKLCTEPPHGSFDSLQGVWEGEATLPDGSKKSTSFIAGKVLDGCGVAAVLNTDGKRVFIAIGYVDRYEHWVAYELDDLPGSLHRYSVSEKAGAGASFEVAPALSIKDEFSLYVTPEAFNTETALERTVWDNLSENELTFRKQKRESIESDWETAEAYSMMRR